MKAAALSEKRAVLMTLWRELGDTPKSGRVLLPQTAAAVAQRIKSGATHAQTEKKDIDPASDDFRL